MAVCFAASGWYFYRHLKSFMILYGSQYIINNNILTDDCSMTAAVMNHSGGRNNHKQIGKQTKKQSVVLHLKINLGTQRETHQWLKYFVDWATGIIGVFKCVPFYIALMCSAWILHFSSHSFIKAEKATLGLWTEQALSFCLPLWFEAMTQGHFVQGTFWIQQISNWTLRNEK